MPILIGMGEKPKEAGAGGPPLQKGLKKTETLNVGNGWLIAKKNRRGSSG